MVTDTAGLERKQPKTADLTKRSAIPREERETAINRLYHQDHWEIWTSDPNMARLLQKRGYEPEKIDREYALFRIPVNAISFRSRSALGKAKGNPENLRRRADNE